MSLVVFPNKPLS